MNQFSPETYQLRRNSLMKSVGNGIIILLGNQEAPMNYTDNVYHFRQDSSFLYYFRVNKPGYFGILDCESNKASLYGYEYTMDDIIWTGPQPSLEDEAVRTGLSDFGSMVDFEKAVTKAKEKGRKIHFLPPYRHDNLVYLSKLLNLSIELVKSEVSIDLVKSIISQRSVKTSEEIANMEEALAVTRQMHMKAAAVTKPGMYEYQAVAEMQKICHSYDMEFAYGIIFSVNGQTLHNHHHHNLMNSGRLVINDSGVENSNCYASDITRTFPVDRSFTNKQKEIYNIVLAMEEKSIESLKPGIMYKDVHIASNKIMLHGLKEIGLVKGDVEEMSEAGVGGLFMPHGLGHMIGLDVHDMEDLGENFVGYTSDMIRSTQLGLKSLRLARKLDPGFVLTVEPGIYFIPELIQKWKAENKFTQYINYQLLESYYDFGGVRIEDNVLITPNGHRVLGEYIPKTIDEIEELKKQNG